MTIFRLKELTSRSLHGAPEGMRWNYDRVELLVDGVVHAVGVCCGSIAAIVLIVLASLYMPGFQVTAVVVYAAGLLLMLAISAV